jgi:hypothetical protein
MAARRGSANTASTTGWSSPGVGIVEYGVEAEAGGGHRVGDGLGVVGDEQGGLLERPPSASGPGGVVEAEGRPVGGSGIGGHGPGQHALAGRIADPGRAPVDDPGQPAVPNHHVAGQQIAVHPHQQPCPSIGGNSFLPNRHRPASVDGPVQLRDRRTDSAVVGLQSTAPTSGGRRPDGIDRLQSHDEAGQLAGQPAPQGTLAQVLDTWLEHVSASAADHRPRRPTARSSTPTSSRP